MSYKVIVADNQAVFRAGAARLIAVEDDFRVVGQCEDAARLYRAVETVSGSLIVAAASLQPRLQQLFLSSRTTNNRLVMVLENNGDPAPYVKQGVPGIVFRDVTQPDLMKCLRKVARGGEFVQERSDRPSETLDSDLVGERARARLTAKELQIVGLIVQGYKNKDIAVALNNTEQVIKNYLRSIFDKTGVSDRLELALFTIHHRILSQAAHSSRPANDLMQ